jgi:nucleosome binding factor SPN SPT16 subunit
MFGYEQVMEAVQTLGGNRRSMMDPDEIEEEQQERDRRNKINKEFEVFVKRMAELWDQPPWRELDLEFDIPFRELGFHGVPNKSSAFIVPTVNCLVELIETPFLVVSLNDIEIVNLERVGLGQKAFDMAIVFKDFKRDILRIDAIPSTSLDGIKEWLNSMNIKYYESRMNLNWRPILKTILEVDLPIISVHFLRCCESFLSLSVKCTRFSSSLIFSWMCSLSGP